MLQPSFGYAVLSGLMLLDNGPFNIVLTTNFDDLVEDAMVHFRSKRPLVIQHESLAPFIRPTRTRPVVVKLHGDHRLAPCNTAEETTQLHTMVSQRVAAVLHDRGLIVMGYGGNDESILRMFESLPDEALPFGIYWVSRSKPHGMFRRWLDRRRAVWVEHGDFDELMLIFKNEFDVLDPDPKHHNRILDDYSAKLKELTESLTRLSGTISRPQKAASEAAKAIAYDLMARQLKDVAPDKAEEYFRWAIDADPKHAGILGNYALFLESVRKDNATAEEYYKRAIEADPKHANNLGNYTRLLLAQGRAEEGLACLQRAECLVDADLPAGLYVELAFYHYAHGPEKDRIDALRKLKKLLTAGSRSPGWDLSPNVERAKSDGHPAGEWLDKLAAVIAQGANTETLADWDEWKQAE